MDTKELYEFKRIFFDIDAANKLQEEQFSKTLANFFNEKLKLHDEKLLEKSIIYYNLPFWWILADNRKERWINKFPQFYSDKERESQYSDFFNYAIDKKSRIIDFTITEFACNKLNKIPEYIHIHFIESIEPVLKLRTNSEDGLINLIIEFGYPDIYLESNLKDTLSTILELPSDFSVEENLVKTSSNIASEINDNSYLELYKFLILNKSVFTDITHVVFLLSKILIDNDGRERSFGGVILALDNKFDFDKSKSILDNYWIKMNIKFREWAIWQWTVKQRRDLIYHSTKSAVAAIMSRNMSHNLGSHVLSNLKGELEEIGKLFKDNHDDTGCLPFKSENLFGLKWFINYLQERQDFIATIGGFENQTFMPVNFKTFVFDGLLPDHQYQRHSTSTNLNAHKNYLLEYIVKSENIQRNQIVIKYKDFVSSVHNTSTEKDYKELTKLNVCFPGGIVGRQAFFSIFENIIRNAAKHSEIKDKLEITIDTPDKGNYDTNEYIKFTLTDNLKTFKAAETNLKNALNELIFNESQEKQGNKGIKEMKISAAWLRGIRLEDIDSYSEEKDDDGFIKQPKILDLNKSDDSIQYVFYLLKPKEILIYITDSEIIDLKLTEDEKKSFNEQGIDVISKEFFQDKNKYNLRHSLFVFHKESEFENDKYIEKYFNQRRLKITAKSLIEILNTHRSNPQNLIAAFWKVYLELEQKPMPLIEIRPSGIDNDNKYERFKVIPNAEGYNNNADIKILFKHHNDSELEFRKFHKDYPDLFGNLRFMEGISGGNSTELLTTKLEKSELFYYKLLQSCLTDVVIIDERLWNNNSKIDITNVTNIIDKKMPLFNQEILDEINMIQDASDWANKIIEKCNINNNEDIKDYLINSYPERSAKGFLQFITKKMPVQTVQNQLTECKLQNEYKYLLYRKKNIEVLNILFNTTNQKEFEFINLSLEIININQLIQNLSLNGQYKIISIHQGIIDKIQNHLTNKQKNQDVNTRLNGHVLDILNQAIPDDFIKIIHSGRGKPSVEIPKGFHFIPYASLESAFYDCKFSLTELLFNAKTELS